DYVLTHRLTPLAPDRTRIECEWLVPSTVDDATYAVEFWDITNREDWAACESGQRGVSSPHLRPGPLAPGEGAGDPWRAPVARCYTDPGEALRQATGKPPSPHATGKPPSPQATEKPPSTKMV